jgi:septum formation topological specificity factor MinE
VSNTPRTDAAYAASIGAGIYELFKVSQDIERELNAANERIRLLIAERDTARRQADQNYKLREEFLDLIGTDDVERGVAVVRKMKERIKRLEVALKSIQKYWNLDSNEGAMNDACWHAINTASEALEAKEDKP